MSKTFIVAEAGVNHNGSIQIAKRLVDLAVKAGADAVKFQTFTAEALLVRGAPKAFYQKKMTPASESQWEMIKKLELNHEAHWEIKRYCIKQGIEFMSTPFDIESLEFLVKELKINKIKIPSGEITNAPLLLKAARTGLPMILSTGMSDLEEIKSALKIIAFGLEETVDQNPTKKGLKQFGINRSWDRRLKGKVTLLHCTSQYPAPYRDINLHAMETLRKSFGLSVGLSDHSLGISVPIAACALGAHVIEKHFTLDKAMPGPDHPTSLDFTELRAMVTSIREVEEALGDGRKVPSKAELKNLPIVRKSLVIKEGIKKGERFTEEHLTCKRPGTGISPMAYWDFLGRPASKGYKPDQLVVR